MRKPQGRLPLVSWPLTSPIASCVATVSACAKESVSIETVNWSQWQREASVWCSLICFLQSLKSTSKTKGKTSCLHHRFILQREATDNFLKSDSFIGQTSDFFFFSDFSMGLFFYGHELLATSLSPQFSVMSLMSLAILLKAMFQVTLCNLKQKYEHLLREIQSFLSYLSFAYQVPMRPCLPPPSL